MATMSMPSEMIVDPHDRESYHALVHLLNRAPLHLQDNEGNAAPVPPELHEALRTLAMLLAADRAALITPASRDLTTQQAADLLGVSRPTLVRLLDSGAIPYTRIRTHRRVPLAALLAYREADRERRRRHLDELVRIGEELGGYAVTPEELAAFRASIRAGDDAPVLDDHDAAD